LISRSLLRSLLRADVAWRLPNGCDRMKQFAVFFLVLLVSCSRAEFDTAVHVEAWLRSLDPNATVIKTRCVGNVEIPPGSGTWEEVVIEDTVTAREALSAAGRFDWDDIFAYFVSMARSMYKPSVALMVDEGLFAGKLTDKEIQALNKTIMVDDVKCDGEKLRNPPPIQVDRCPNDIDGCDDDSEPVDPPLFPTPSPTGGGDF
jgi:hypothetical protein